MLHARELTLVSLIKARHSVLLAYAWSSRRKLSPYWKPDWRRTL